MREPRRGWLDPSILSLPTYSRGSALPVGVGGGGRPRLLCHSGLEQFLQHWLGTGMSNVDRLLLPGESHHPYLGLREEGAVSSWLHLPQVEPPSHWAVLTEIYYIFLNKCFSICCMPLGQFPVILKFFWNVVFFNDSCFAGERVYTNLYTTIQKCFIKKYVTDFISKNHSSTFFLLFFVCLGHLNFFTAL